MISTRIESRSCVWCARIVVAVERERERERGRALEREGDEVSTPERMRARVRASERDQKIYACMRYTLAQKRREAHCGMLQSIAVHGAEVQKHGNARLDDAARQ